MKALLVAFILVAAPTAFAQTTYVDIPADEAAMARAPMDALKKMDDPKTIASIKKETCRRHLLSAYSVWEHGQLVKTRWDDTKEKKNYLEDKCGDSDDFNAALVAEMKRRSELENQQFRRELAERHRDADSIRKKRSKCDNIVTSAIGEASRSRMTIFSQREYAKAGCGDAKAFSKAYSENMTSMPGRIARGLVDMGVGAGRSIAGAAKSGLERMNLIRPSNNGSSNAGEAKATGRKASN